MAQIACIMRWISVFLMCFQCELRIISLIWDFQVAGFGKVEQGEIGVIQEFQGDKVVCAFPSQAKVRAFIDELEPVTDLTRYIMVKDEGCFLRGEVVVVVAKKMDRIEIGGKMKKKENW
jgi:hypothetical protein